MPGLPWRHQRTVTGKDSLGRQVVATTGVTRDDRGISVAVLSPFSPGENVVITDQLLKDLAASARGAMGDAASERRGGGIR